MISIVVPFYNEKESVRELHSRVLNVLRKMGESFEIILVDDGSKDGTFDEMKNCTPVKAIRLARNFGQTAGFAAGIAAAKGDVIVTMDGDLENHPEDIPLLVSKLNEGYDVVAGW